MFRWFFVSRSGNGRSAEGSAIAASPSLARFPGLACWAALGAIVGFAGCSSKVEHGDRKPVFAVRGKLLVDHQPAPGAMLVLHPMKCTATSVRAGQEFSRPPPIAPIVPGGSRPICAQVGMEERGKASRAELLGAKIRS